MKRGSHLIGGLSADEFLRRHWQRRPLLVRDTGERAFVDRRRLFALAANPDVESRLVVRDATGWTLTHGPIAARARPPLAQPGWTLLVQGVDLHVQAAHELLHRFAFLSWARLDDVMVSFATDGGGVGAHVDAYDVFLLQLEGRRRWRVGPVGVPNWQPGVPLKLLARFEPTDEWVLGPGDMLYLPPGWGHEGVAEGPRCLTASVGFRAPSGDELVRELLPRIAEAIDDEGDDDDAGIGANREGSADEGTRPAPGAQRYRDPRRAGSRAAPRAAARASGLDVSRASARDAARADRAAPAAAPGRIDPTLSAFAARHLRRALEGDGIALALGEWLTEPKPRVWFDTACAERDAGDADRDWRQQGLALDRRSRMLYDDRAVFLNGQSYLVQGRDARLLRRLADQRRLDTAECRGFGTQARHTIDEWWAAGWVIPSTSIDEETAPTATAPASADRRP